MDIISKTVYKSDSTFNLIKYPLKELFVIDNLYLVNYQELSLTFDSKGDFHDFWEVVYIDSGKVAVKADGVEYELTSGQLIIYSPNVVHSLKASENTAPNSFILTFDSQSRYLKFLTKTVFSLTPEEKKILSGIMKECEASFVMGKTKNLCMIRKNNAPAGSLQLIKLYLEQLMISLLRRHGSGKSLSKSGKQSNHARERSLSESIIEYMDENIEKNISLDEIAKNFAVSVSTAKKVFKAETGRTIKDFFMDKKISFAKKAIRETAVNYTIIAKNLGFSSVHHFSAFFKKKTGKTPTEYDKSIRS